MTKDVMVEAMDGAEMSPAYLAASAEFQSAARSLQLAAKAYEAAQAGYRDAIKKLSETAAPP